MNERESDCVCVRVCVWWKSQIFFSTLRTAIVVVGFFPFFCGHLRGRVSWINFVSSNVILHNKWAIDIFKFALCLLVCFYVSSRLSAPFSRVSIAIFVCFVHTVLYMFRFYCCFCSSFFVFGLLLRNKINKVLVSSQSSIYCTWLAWVMRNKITAVYVVCTDDRIICTRWADGVCVCTGTGTRTVHPVRPTVMAIV